MYTLYREQLIETNIERAWEFIKNPKNLDAITPDDMKFTILSEIPEEMYNGLLIEYEVKIPLFGKKKWLTEIKHIREGRSFVDEQRIGPYKLWYHYHEIMPEGNRVKFIDKVTYDVPFGIIGRTAHFLFIKRILDKIFDFRKTKLLQILSDFNIS
jgi:ligand-binding SRPBCC domain-containing protein